MILCDAQEHYYDKDKHTECPHCASTNSDNANNQDNVIADEDAQKTKKKVATKFNDNQQDEDKTIILGGSGKSKHAGVQKETKKIANETDKTIIFRKNKESTDSTSEDDLPVAGWLVITEGKGVGKDFRLIQGPNTVGRANNNDVVINCGDQTISSNAHITVHYNNVDNEFVITPGNSRNAPRVNDKALYQVQLLADHDIIQIGATKVMFISLCNDDFQW